MTNLTQKEIEEFDKKFKKIPVYADFDKNPIPEGSDKQIAYCLTCERFIIEEGCLCGVANVDEVKAYLSQKKAEWQNEVIEAIPNEVDGDSEVDILKVKQNLKSQFKGKENND